MFDKVVRFRRRLGKRRLAPILAAMDDRRDRGAEPGMRVLRRFLPYLWPADAPGLRLRVVIASLFVLLSIGVTTLVMPLAFGAAVNRMTAGMEPLAAIAIALVCAYAAARFAGVLFDNMRNGLFERV